ncbi:acyl-CoA dehydrogenase family protein [Sneathiella sp.]|uniref:acyl-CoA dehydrogenase family protein n=1 Tax=Sneathiella sp. TaxID=1964365 RepID=UPI003569E4E6
MNFAETFQPPAVSPELEALRQEVRGFLGEVRKKGEFDFCNNSWAETFSPEFSRLLGARGWIGYHWPEEYGGRGGSYLATYTINEEMLAVGAPIGAHWIAARQSGPLLMKFGTEEQRQKYLPRIARGESFFAIGMSEPDSGSDLAAVRTRATLQEDGRYILKGRKIWSTGAHKCDHMIVLCRTSPLDTKHRHQGITQFVVDLTLDGISIHPIRSIDGNEHFNEVVFDDVVLEPDALVGTEGGGWNQVTSELGYERSGPERYLSVMPLIEAFAKDSGNSEEQTRTLGRLSARLLTQRAMSLGITSELVAGRSPVFEAALSKDLGTIFEQDAIEIVRAATEGTRSTELSQLLQEAICASPAFTIRGGTTQILRMMISKEVLPR